MSDQNSPSFWSYFRNLQTLILGLASQGWKSECSCLSGNLSKPILDNKEQGFWVYFQKDIKIESWKNICRLFQILTPFLFTRNEKELHYYHQKINRRIAPRNAKQLRLKIFQKFKGSFKEISEILGLKIVRKLGKFSCEAFHRKTIFFDFRDLQTIFLFKFVDLTSTLFRQ